MALDPNNMLPTPENYATQSQLDSLRAYSNALINQKQPPIYKPWEGMSQVANALIGGYFDNQANQKQIAKGQQNAAAGQISPVGAASPTSPANAAISSAVSSAVPSSGGSLPASIRSNNPGAMWPSGSSARFGSNQHWELPDGNKIAVFDDPVNGAAAHFDLLAKNYTGMPLRDAITKWSGGNSSPAYTNFVAQNSGITPDTTITKDLLASPQGAALAKSMSRWEAGRDFPLSDEGWQKAQGLAFPTAASTPNLPDKATVVKAETYAPDGTLTSPPSFIQSVTSALQRQSTSQ
jgi:hypothetical protein